MQHRDTHSMRYLQPIHTRYIDKYGHLLTQKQISFVTGFSIATINTYCRANHIETTKTYFQPDGFLPPPLDADDVSPDIDDNPFRAKREYNTVPAAQPDKHKEIVRPLAVYDNPSRDDIINKYLKMDI